MTKQKQTKIFQSLKVFIVIVGAIMAAIAAIAGINSYLDSRIESVVNEEQFIRRVSSQVRPYVIFDATSIHNDGGAMKYLEDTKVDVIGQTYKNINPEEKHDYHLEITVFPKQHLAHAPLIEPIGGLRSIIIYDGKRGTKYQWVYTVLVRPPYGGDIKTQKFRLEILR